MFIGIDCSCGTNLNYQCDVKGRQYVAPWTEFTSSTDSDGNVHFNTIHHQAEYHLFCEDTESGYSFDVNTTPMKFNTITNGQAVEVWVRKGRFTGAKYLPRI